LLLVSDYSHWPFPVIAPVVSPFYEQLAMESGDFAIAPLPAGRQASKYHMYYQTVHGKKIVGGHVSRTPPEARRFTSEHDLLRALRRNDPIVSEITDISRQLDRLAEVDIRYLVLHKDQVSSDVIERVRTFLSLHPAYEDEYLIAYHTDLELGRDYSFAYALTPALGLLRVRLSPPDEVHQGTFIGLEIHWGAAEPPGRDLSLQVQFVDQTGEVAQTEQMVLYPEWPSARWSPDTLVIGRYRARVDARLPAGEYEVHIGVMDAMTGESVGDSVAVSSLRIRPVARVYEMPSPQFQFEGCFGERLCILGYDVRFHDDHLLLVLYWRGTRLMEQDYVMSTRLVDPSNGGIVWARDAAPRDWTYPTTWWDAGEVVSETLVCDLDDVPAGRYRLAFVVYEPRSGEVLTTSVIGQPEQSGDQVLPVGEVSVPQR
jgi:hypothetical protein